MPRRESPWTHPVLPHERLAQEVGDVVLWTAIAVLLAGIVAWFLPA